VAALEAVPARGTRQGALGANEEDVALSPNQRAKRDLIVSAAVEVLLRDGIHACTVRSIASAAGISKSALHYYFADVDEVVDQAMHRATQGWVAWLRASSSGGGRSRDAVGVLWRAVECCLEPFAHGDRSLLPLWLEYFALRGRQGRLEPLRRVHEVLVDYVSELLEAAGVRRYRERARAVTAYLFGASMQESIGPLAAEEIRAHVSALCGLPSPSRAQLRD
jgi:AcrR family transcriptional regulator